MQTTAERLRKLLSDRNLRQTDVIRMAQPYCDRYKVKLNKSDLSQFISGKVVPGQWKISILAHALDVSEAWLMGYDVPIERDRSGDQVTDPRTDELLQLFARLTDAQKDFVLASIRGLLSAP